WQPRNRIRVTRRQPAGNANKLAIEFVKSGRFQCAHRYDRRISQKRSAQKVFNLESNDFQSLRIDHVGFCEYGYSVPDSEQTANIEMLARLRLDAFIGCNDKQYQINTANPGKHVAHEPLVPGHIDEPKSQPFTGWAWQLRVCKTQIDGYSAALFFPQSVGIDPSKGLDQRGFPMIDMAGSANNDGLHRSSVYSAIRPHAGQQHSNHMRTAALRCLVERCSTACLRSASATIVLQSRTVEGGCPHATELLAIFRLSLRSRFGSSLRSLRLKAFE